MEHAYSLVHQNNTADQPTLQELKTYLEKGTDVCLFGYVHSYSVHILRYKTGAGSNGWLSTPWTRLGALPVERNADSATSFRKVRWKP